MNTTISNRIGRYLALSVMSAAITGGTAVGLAGTAHAAPGQQPILLATPQVKANPAPDAVPGGWWHRHKVYLYPQSTARDFIHPATQG